MKHFEKNRQSTSPLKLEVDAIVKVKDLTNQIKSNSVMNKFEKIR